MEKVSDIIRDLREDRNLKQRDLCSVLNVSQQTYSSYETGDTELPACHAVTLADYYGVTTDYILGRVSYSQQIPSLDSPFIAELSMGEYISMILQLNDSYKKHLMIYADYLLERQKKKQD